MASLLSLLNEVLIQVLIVSPTIRTLLRLSAVNRRMRAIDTSKIKTLAACTCRQCL